MKTITKTIELYEYNELNEKAKENVKNWFLNDYSRSEFFYDDIKLDLSEKFKNSDLDVTFSLAYCQGDGLNIYGDLNLYDFIPKWDATEKEKRTISFYLDKTYHFYKFEKNNRYCYSCKFIDKYNINNTIDDFISDLEYYSVKNINSSIIEKFFNDMIDYFDELDSYYQKQGYEYLYNISDDEIAELCEINEYYFNENGCIA
jgi:hypothetical protein